MHSIPGRRLIISSLLVFLLLPIYWLVNMSSRPMVRSSRPDAVAASADHCQLHAHLHDESWYSGYINSLKYVLINTVISISVALPAAYGFSRYRFLGDKHLFFLAAVEPDGAGGGLRAAVLQPLFAISLFDTPWA